MNWEEENLATLMDIMKDVNEKYYVIGTWVFSSDEEAMVWGAMLAGLQ